MFIEYTEEPWAQQLTQILPAFVYVSVSKCRCRRLMDYLLFQVSFSLRISGNHKTQEQMYYICPHLSNEYFSSKWSSLLILICSSRPAEEQWSESKSHIWFMGKSLNFLTLCCLIWKNMLITIYLGRLWRNSEEKKASSTRCLGCPQQARGPAIL